MSQLIISLFEGDYCLGAGSLVNSLYSAGFRGRVYCGHKGALTHWTSSAAAEGMFRVYRAAADLEIRFFPVDHPWHLTNLKPHLMLRVWEEWEPQAEAVFYFDPDITIKARWSFFQEWVGYGLPLVADPVMDPMPPDHPFRMAWARWLREQGYEPVRWPDAYYNGGFIGFTKERIEDLRTWRDLHDRMAEVVPLERFAPVPRTDLFCMTDQDAMNMLAMITPGPLSTMGPEGMDFKPAGVVMSHAAGGEKPWRKRFVLSALRGVPPTLADKGWLAHTSGPIQVLGENEIRRKQREVRIASAIGRIVRRS